MSRYVKTQVTAGVVSLFRGFSSKSHLSRLVEMWERLNQDDRDSSRDKFMEYALDIVDLMVCIYFRDSQGHARVCA